jgi:hypothetical protein
VGASESRPFSFGASQRTTAITTKGTTVLEGRHAPPSSLLSLLSSLSFLSLGLLADLRYR